MGVIIRSGVFAVGTLNFVTVLKILWTNCSSAACDERNFVMLGV